MKKTILLLIIISLLSCNDNKYYKLEERISELVVMVDILTERNKVLEDSLNKIEYKNITSHELIGIQSNNKLLVNQPNRFTFVFPNRQKFHKYDVFEINKKNKTRRLLYENLTESRFNYDFIPKNNDDKSFQLEAQFNLDSIIVIIPAHINTTLTE